jgi:ubiquinone/menaquinone biosynthesis C-methylase UbiE
LVSLVDTLYPSKGSVVVELGPGNGISLEHLLKTYAPKRVYGIDISERFRSLLQSKFDNKITEEGIVSIHDNDAKDLAFFKDNSVDAVYALNVVYFLDPLKEYLQEIQRILKPSVGKVVFGVAEEAKRYGQKMEKSIFVNTDWDTILQAMKAAGFESVEMTAPQETKIGSPFVALLGTKAVKKNPPAAPVVPVKSNDDEETMEEN